MNLALRALKAGMLFIKEISADKLQYSCSQSQGDISDTGALNFEICHQSSLNFSVSFRVAISE